MRFIQLAAISASLFLSTAYADFGEYREHALAGQTLSIHSTLGELRITAIDDAAFEVHYIEQGSKQLPSFALAGEPPAIAAAVAESDISISFSIDGLTAVVSKSPVHITYLRNGEALLAEDSGYFANETLRGFRFELDDGEKILGGGQRVLGMDRRGQRMPLYNKAHYEYRTESSQMYYGLPAVMSSDRYMIIFDNSASGWLDIGHTETDVLSFEAVAGRTAYLVVAGATYPDLIDNYTNVTGRQPLPPRWAFGNFASRFGYHDEKEVRNVVRRYQRAGIPLDAVVLDLFWYGPDIKGHVGNLAWDRQAFPTPEDMMADFAKQGVRTIAITQPFVLSTSKRWQEAVDNDVLAKDANGDPYRFDFYFGNTGLIDVFDQSARDWFWQAYARLFSQGVSGSWGDLGEPEVHPDDILHWLSDAEMPARGDEVHNAFGHAWAQMVYEMQVENYPDMRPLLLMRSGFAGSHRYGIIPWTGDVSRSWGGLKPQTELNLQMGLFGLAYTHSDLGGFAAGKEFDRELYIRWLQYGVFHPVYRPHGQEHIPSEPVFHDRKTRRIVRDFVKLRYRLLPYNYTLAYENSTSGMPLARPLFFEDESDIDLIDEKDAYLWGDAFLVAPVTDAGVDAVDVDLPPGVWFDFWNGRRLEGARSVSIPVTLETIPVLVRAGSFIPMIDDIDTTRDYSSEKLTLHYYADASVQQSSGYMYEDDGESRQSLEQGEFEILRFTADQQGKALAIELQRDGGDYPGRPASRDLEIVIHNWTDAVDDVRFGDESVRASHDRKANTLTLRVQWQHDTQRLDVNPQARIAGKPVIYQVFTRLFGNTNETNRPWGTIEENGVGKFSDFTDEALESIRELGVTHIWYTGVPHHAVIRDYTRYGIGNDDPDVVKGRAGSPYAIKDYYSVNPDLADNPAQRVEEFAELIDRTHRHNIKVVIDIVPNHIARNYQSLGKPDDVVDFGGEDDTTVEWARDNNFYYIVGEDFAVPSGYTPLGGEPHPLADGQFEESPAKWTGNGSRSAKPNIDDWFETVKINFGVRPDGSFAFDRLPDDARDWTSSEHAAFWADKDVPDSWIKFRDVALFWIDKGVDGFRYDMAELVPVEFWSFLNSSIRSADPDAMLIAEIYNPPLYRDYIALGGMEFLYDKTGLYDTLKPVIQGDGSTDSIAAVHAEVLDIEEHMLHFLENHDEQRIASAGFAGDADKAKPAMVVSTLLGRAPTMIYFGQEVGEPGDGDAGFGDPTRTTIFDYWGVPAHQRWMNGGRFDGGRSTDSEKQLRDFYARLLGFSAVHPAMRGDYAEIHSHNRQLDNGYDDQLYAFARWLGDERLLVVSNFSDAANYELTIEVPAEIISAWQLGPGRYELDEQLYGSRESELVVDAGIGLLHVELGPLESVVYRVGEAAFQSALDPATYLEDADNAGTVGTLVHWPDVRSEFLNETRHVQVWLPPDYSDDPTRRYPVIYMPDGQNLFDPRIASWGIDWGIDEAIVRGSTAGDFRSAIVVGAWSTSQRLYEYSPWDGAPQYARFLIEELMPRVNREFRTLTGPANTFTVGSSGGGLLSYYLVREHADVFGACGCLSTHFPLSPAMIASFLGEDPTGLDDTPLILRDIADGATMPATARPFFDYGTEGLDASYEPTHLAVRDWLLSQGRVEGEDFVVREYPGADHSESAWRVRVGDHLEWMLSGE